ncbi:Rieske (2Fe-2S) protein [Prauserella oleivorans]|uniref:Cytochrome bc1 complex Rieske iron-sulfur subunit n=1 Tax=Prauserella oleivorans TaxID=1478153 RepID=A0ABW5W7A3_9PSEU
MTAQPHTRRTVLTTGAAVAGAAAGTVALAACGGDENTTAPAPPSQPAADAPAGTQLAALGEVPVGGTKAVKTPDGRDAVLSRPRQNQVACFSAVCTHQGCKVNAEGAQLVCPCHGSVFDAFTGDVKEGPADQPLPAIDVRIQNDRIVTA